MKLLYLVCFGEAKEDDFIFGNLLKGCPSRVKLKLHFWWCLTFSSQTMRDVYSPNNVWAQFQPGSSRLGNFKDWLLYGKHIENLCTGLPLYQLVATERKSPIRALWLCLRAPPPALNPNPCGTLELCRHLFLLSCITSVLHSCETNRSLG